VATELARIAASWRAAARPLPAAAPVRRARSRPDAAPALRAARAALDDAPALLDLLSGVEVTALEYRVVRAERGRC
jgi:hypothetical protein